MSVYQGYRIEKNPETGKFDIFWKEKKVAEGLTREADAEEWIDDQFPSNRTS